RRAVDDGAAEGGDGGRRGGFGQADGRARGGGDGFHDGGAGEWAWASRIGRCGLVLQQHAEGGRLDVVELPVADGPPEGGHAHAGEHDGERDEDEEDVHG